MQYFVIFPCGFNGIIRNWLQLQSYTYFYIVHYKHCKNEIIRARLTLSELKRSSRDDLHINVCWKCCRSVLTLVVPAWSVWKMPGENTMKQLLQLATSNIVKHSGIQVENAKCDFLLWRQGDVSVKGTPDLQQS